MSDDDYLQQIMAERRKKAESMRAAGQNPWANDWKPGIDLAALRSRYEGTKPTAPPASKQIVPVDEQIHRVSGRVMARRGFGKSTFAPVRDGSGDLQLFLNLDNTEGYAQISEWLDVGDIVGAEGPIFWTQKGEMSLLCKRVRILTKSLRPMPEKWHGLTDVELRYRQRWMDMAVNPAVRDVFRKRTQVISSIRRFLDERGFLEVETPMMHSILGGAAAKPFRTHHNALDIDLYMRIAPELFLKRLLVGGFERVYEIGRNFRNEGLSRKHNPEFTMLEFYWAYATYEDLMRLTEELFSQLAREVAGSTTVEFEGASISLEPPFRRLSVKDAVVNVAGKSAEVFDDPELAARVAREVGVDKDDVARVLASDDPPRVRAGQLGMAIFEKTAEATLVQPTFLVDFPLAVSPLARKKESDPAFCDRFELFVAGSEMANAFSELNDPDDQRSRFEAQLKARASGADETMDYDEDYCRALELGMPPAAGQGIGIDRLTMLLTGQPSIRDVILFPLMRPE